MRVTIRCVCSTVDVSPSVRQVDAAFSRVVAERAADMPEFELLRELVISTSVGPWEDKLRRSTRQSICHVTQHIAYKAWIAADWPARVDLMAAAFLAGLEAVPRKRILDSEHATLRDIAESTRLGAHGSPPACVEKIVPTIGDAPPVAPTEERLFKLYKRIDGRMHYREGWIGNHTASQNIGALAVKRGQRAPTAVSMPPMRC